MNYLRYALLGSVASLCACPTPAWAQAASPDDSGLPATGEAPDAQDGLGAIIVTAQRRAENLQDVPIAATALAGDQLDEKAITSVADLQFAAPSLSVTDAGETQSVNIR